VNLILLRHGENEKVGELDLTDNGKQFSDAVANHLAKLSIRAIYVSGENREFPTRSIDTVRPLAQRLGLEVNLLWHGWLFNQWLWETETADYDVLVFRSTDFTAFTDSMSPFHIRNLESPDDKNYHRIIVLTGLMSRGKPLAYSNKQIILTGVASRTEP